MRILIVDDSVVFRSAIKTALDGIPGIEIAGTANNGRIALQKLAQSSIDLVTLDMEMPELGGIETIREMKKAGFKCRIIIFSSHTTRGSEAALEALTAGADDFVAKPSGTESSIEAAAARSARYVASACATMFHRTMICIQCILIELMSWRLSIAIASSP